MFTSFAIGIIAGLALIVAGLAGITAGRITLTTLHVVTRAVRRR